MLQQTQVGRVVERFASFMHVFPGVRALAGASEQAVLAEWQGLGYYRRARLLHAAARMVVEEFGGRVPRTAGELVRLPGVGRYSAGAIASIVFGERTPIVDGNVQRVLARLDGRRGRLGDAGLVRWAWGRAEQLVEACGDPAAFNEALMELGAVVCTPGTPDCAACPLAGLCTAHRQGRQAELPAPQKAVRRKREHWHAVVVSNGRRVLFERRAARGMWSNMWQVPTVVGPKGLSADALRSGLARRNGDGGGPVAVGELTRRGSFEHGTTHRLIVFHVYTTSSRARKGTWRRLDDIDDLPMSNAQAKVLALVAGQP